MKKLKNITKDSTKDRTQPKRSRSKYPALDKSLNTKARADYIEPEYVNGVYDDDGNQIIRPLTDDEKQFLNTFYEETIVTNFQHDKELKRLNKIKKNIIEDETVLMLKDEINKLDNTNPEGKKRIKEIKEIIKITKQQNQETYAEDLETIEEMLQDQRNEVLIYSDPDDHKVFYSENNARNNCIFNRAKGIKKLILLEPEEYDQFVSKRIQGLDYEHLLLEDFRKSSKKSED